MRRTRTTANRATAIGVCAGLPLLALSLGGCAKPAEPEVVGPPPRPNVLLIVADDLGYSDLGAYGSEIPTPRLDALARRGVRATDFYTAPNGVPTRAMLLTGVDNHAAGFSAPPRRADSDAPGRGGTLRADVVTVSELLQASGYYTVMAGKWRMGRGVANRPGHRGFERSFALHDGAASHWSDMRSAVVGRERALFTRNDEVLEQLPDDHYSTRAFADFLIERIGTERVAGRPFFAYLSLQAPHGPLAVPEKWLERTAGTYDDGFDKIRGARLLRAQSMGIVGQDVTPYPGIPTVPRWKELSPEQREAQSRRMELYAAMVANVDFHVGRLLEHLRQMDELDDTLVIFLSDNGPEPADRGPAGMDARDRDWYAEHFPRTDLQDWGKPGSFVEVGPAWAQVSSVPFRMFKGTMAEGGIRVPLILAGPGISRFVIERGGRLERSLLHVADIPATILDVAGVEHPARWDGKPVAPIQGRSLVPLMAREWRGASGLRDWIAFSYGGSRAVREGPWKLVQMPRPFGVDAWRLYRLDRDPSELFDLSKKRPRRHAALLRRWAEYAAEQGLEPEPAPAP
ncbi:MAG: arylsulfatase [Myxococcota bacterium]|nr:arylsulfatase [Myxococcota bacterium]